MMRNGHRLTIGKADVKRDPILLPGEMEDGIHIRVTVDKTLLDHGDDRLSL